MQAESGKSFDPKVVEILASHYRETGASRDRTFRISRSCAVRFSHRRRAAGSAAVVRAGAGPGQFSEPGRNVFGAVPARKTTVPARHLAVYIRREDRLEAEYATGVDCLQVGSAIVPWGEGICGRAAATATASLNEDPLESPGPGERRRGYPLRSSLAIPLEGFSGVVGVLCLYSQAKNAFTEEHLRVLSAVATKVAVSVENALKYRQAERSAVTDMLTELPNARSLFLHLDSELSRAKRIGSDHRGAGVRSGRVQADQRPVRPPGRQSRAASGGARLRSHCREYDTVARLGGDEFVIVLPGQQPESVNSQGGAAGQRGVASGI